MSSYNKRIKGDNNTANEQLAHNRIFIDMHGAGPLTLALFLVVCIGGAIAWMMLKNGGLLAFMVTASFICIFLGAGAVGAMFVVRYYSATKRQLASDRAAQAWERDVLYTQSHVISRIPNIRVENAREISEVRHYNDRPQISEHAESFSSFDVPSSEFLKQ